MDILSQFFLRYPIRRCVTKESALEYILYVWEMAYGNPKIGNELVQLIKMG